MNAIEQLPPRRMTVPEFLAWTAAVDGTWQLRDGEPEPVDSSSAAHAGIQAELCYMLTAHLRATANALHAATEIAVIPRVRADRTLLIPDVVVTATKLSAAMCFVDPLILFDIVSPSNERQTRANLWAYSTIPTAAEIVAITSTDVAAEIWRRRPDGTWPEAPEPIARNGRLRLASIGFDEALIDVYRTTDLFG